MFIFAVLLLIGGAILKYVEPPFFLQAPQVGLILMWAGAGILVLVGILSAFARRSFNKSEREILGDRWPNFPNR